MLNVQIKLQPKLNPPMKRLKLLVLHLALVSFGVESQQTAGPDFPDPDDTNFQPSLVVVVGILGVLFVSTFVILAYAKFCRRREPVRRNSVQNRTGIISSSNRFSGIDKTVVEALPFFRFSSLKGSKEGLECAVCLSKFDDVEVLRLLPKCKHAFHVTCIDHWLEKHATCPLCRHRVSSEDLKLIAYSNSLRFLWNDESEPREDLNNMELFVQREESRRGSSRFSIGSSFRKIHEKGGEKGDELLIRKGVEEENMIFHKHNHRIITSDFVFSNCRWSNLSSSDLVFLNSEMLNDMSSDRFSSMDMSSRAKAAENEEIMKIKEEMGMKKSFESKVGAIGSASDGRASSSSHLTTRSVMSSGEQRSASEITAFSRYGDSGLKSGIGECSLTENNVKEERIRRIWLPIARRTVEWFANRERRSQLPQNSQTQPLDV